MVEPRTLRRAGFRAMFLAIAGLVIFVRLLPVDIGGSHIPTPDIVLLLIFAWVVRRPDYVPVAMLAGLALFADVVFVRPLGLWALLTVLGSEVLRRRSRGPAVLSFPLEWLLVAATLLAMCLAQIVILGIALVPQPPIGAQALHFLVSVLAYPLVAAATIYGSGVRRPGRTEREAARWA